MDTRKEHRSYHTTSSSWRKRISVGKFLSSIRKTYHQHPVIAAESKGTLSSVLVIETQEVMTPKFLANPSHA